MTIEVELRTSGSYSIPSIQVLGPNQPSLFDNLLTGVVIITFSRRRWQMSPDPCNGHHQLSAGLYTVNISRTVPLLLVHLNIFSPSHHPDCQCDIVCNKLGNWTLTRWSGHTVGARDTRDAVTRDRVCDVTRMSGKIIGRSEKLWNYQHESLDRNNCM